MQHFKNRLNSSQTKALLANITKRFPAEIIMHDLASDEEVSEPELIEDAEEGEPVKEPEEKAEKPAKAPAEKDPAQKPKAEKAQDVEL